MTVLEPELSPSTESDLPEGWAEATLNHVLVALETGSRPTGGVRGILDGLPSIGGEHLNDEGGFRFENVKYVPKQFFERMSRGHIYKGDILIVKDGATTGKVSLVGDDFPYPSAVVNEHVFICRTTPHLDSRFLFRFLHSEEGQRRILENFRGSAQGGINQSFAPGTAIVIAPLAEQQRIVAKVEELLASVNAVRERLARTTKLLKRFRQSVLAAACSGRLTADWRVENPDVEPASALLARILREKNPPPPPVPARSSPPGGARSQQKLAFTDEPVLAPPVAGGGGGLFDLLDGIEEHQDSNPGPSVLETDALPTVLYASDLPEVPETWCWTKFRTVISELRNGVSIKPETDPPGTPMLRINAVRPGKVLFDDVRYLRNQDVLIKIYQLQNDDLLFTRYNGSLDLLGVCGMVRDLNSQVLLYPDKLMRVRFNHLNIMPAYAEIFFQSPDTRLRVTGKSKSSAGQQGVSGEDIKSQPFAVPPLAEQQEIVRRVERLFSLADAIERRVADAAVRADKLAQAVLAKAFRGELVPTEAELARQEGRDYEPASVLLERVRAERAAAGAKSPPRPSRGGRV